METLHIHDLSFYYYIAYNNLNNEISLCFIPHNKSTHIIKKNQIPSRKIEFSLYKLLCQKFFWLQDIMYFKPTFQENRDFYELNIQHQTTDHEKISAFIIRELSQKKKKTY